MVTFSFLPFGVNVILNLSNAGLTFVSCANREAIVVKTNVNVSQKIRTIFFFVSRKQKKVSATNVSYAHRETIRK